MNAFLVDSDILLDVITEDPEWFTRSSAVLARVAEDSMLIVTPHVYGEVAVAFDRIEELEEALPETVFRREPIPFEAAFLAAERLRVAARSGEDAPPIATLLLGAHAALLGAGLLTRRVDTFRRLFPAVTIVAP